MVPVTHARSILDSGCHDPEWEHLGEAVFLLSLTNDDSVLEIFHDRDSRRNANSETAVITLSDSTAVGSYIHTWPASVSGTKQNMVIPESQRFETPRHNVGESLIRRTRYVYGSNYHRRQDLDLFPLQLLLMQPRDVITPFLRRYLVNREAAELNSLLIPKRSDRIGISFFLAPPRCVTDSIYYSITEGVVPIETAPNLWGETHAQIYQFYSSSSNGYVLQAEIAVGTEGQYQDQTLLFHQQYPGNTHIWYTLAPPQQDKEEDPYVVMVSASRGSSSGINAERVKPRSAQGIGSYSLGYVPDPTKVAVNSSVKLSVYMLLTFFQSMKY